MDDHRYLIEHASNGRYTLLQKEEIGRGTFGVVYEGIDTSNGEAVAVKFVLLKKPEQIKTIEGEIKILKTLSRRRDSGIVKYRTHYKVAYKTVTYFIIITDLITGISLIDYIENLFSDGRTVDLDIAINIMYDLIRIIKLVHNSGVAHRDIKPDNIIFEIETGRMVLIDFGFACSPLMAVSCEGRIVGTANYLAPEILYGYKNIYKDIVLTQMSDIWSLGVTFYILLNLKLPFDGENREQVMYAISKSPVPKSNYGVEPLDNLVNSMLQKNMFIRPEASTLLTELESMIEF